MVKRMAGPLSRSSPGSEMIAACVGMSSAKVTSSETSTDGPAMRTRSTATRFSLPRGRAGNRAVAQREPHLRERLRDPLGVVDVRAAEEL